MSLIVPLLPISGSYLNVKRLATLTTASSSNNNYLIITLYYSRYEKVLKVSSLGLHTKLFRHNKFTAINYGILTKRLNRYGLVFVGLVYIFLFLGTLDFQQFAIIYFI
jgi:hypothetical protein